MVAHIVVGASAETQYVRDGIAPMNGLEQLFTAGSDCEIHTVVDG